MNYKNVIHHLTDHIQKTDPKKMWVVDNLQYLTLGGSHAYGTETSNSDWDCYGITIPPRKYLYPSEKGLIFGYDIFPTFNQLEYQSKVGDKHEHVDITIYNIVQYFKLLRGNNPNIIDSIFTKQNCVLFITDIGQLIVDNREVFLHKGVFTKFKSYAFNQLNKIKTNPDDRESPARKELIKKHGYDSKNALNIFRLLGECEQLLSTGTMDLTRDREQLKRVRDGFYSLEEIHEFFKRNEIELEKLYHTSTLPQEPKEELIRDLLLECLSRFYF